MAKQTTTTEIHWIIPLASIAIIVAALHFAKALLIPLTLAVLLSFLLSPICDWLERRRLGRVPAVLGTALLGFTILGLGAWAATKQMSQMGPRIPEFSRNIEQRLEKMNVNAVSLLGIVTRSAQDKGDNDKDDQEEGVLEQVALGMGTDQAKRDSEKDGDKSEKDSDSVEVISAFAGSMESFGGMFGTLLEILGTIGIVIVLVIFFLIRREDLRDRFVHLMGEGNVSLTTRMLEDANSRVRSYLSMLFLINATFGMSVAVGLYFIGVPSAILWGIVAASLRFIPYVGPWIAAALPIALSFAISSGWVVPLLTIGLFVVLELFSNNVMEPLLYGRNTGVSAVAVLVAAIFWMWLWGPIGLVLATPLTVCVLVLGKHIPQLSFLQTLLGSDPVFEPKTRIYQRLLAGDQEEAKNLVEGFVRCRSLVEVYDSVLVPAIALNEKHWQQEDLYEEKYRFIMRSLREMIRDCGERPQTLVAIEDALDSGPVTETARYVADNDASPLKILCLPAHTESDELTALMLSQVLQTPDTRASAVPIKSLEGDLSDRFAANKADVICVCATPPAAVMHARNFCKQIRDQLPHVKLIVGLWDTPDAMDATTERFGHDAVVVVTMADAQEQIRQLIAATAKNTDVPAEVEHEQLPPFPAVTKLGPLISA